MFSHFICRLKIEHFKWNCTEFFITLKQPMSEMLGKITFFLLIWNLKIVKGFNKNQRQKTSLTDKKSIFMAFLTRVAAEL